MSAADAIRAREAARKPVVVKPPKPAKVAVPVEVPAPAPPEVVEDVAVEVPE